MITYYPWSELVLSSLLAGHDRGELSTLDLELTAKCTQADCIYCDSKPEVGAPNPNELSFEHIKSVLEQGHELGLKWIYTCGLGEPLEDDRFERMVEAASALGICGPFVPPSLRAYTSTMSAIV